MSGDTFLACRSIDEILGAARRNRRGVVFMHDVDDQTADAAGRAEFVLSLTCRLVHLARDEQLHIQTMAELMKQFDDKRSRRV